MPIESELAYEYEATHSKLEAKNQGIFYTPSGLVRRMTKEGLRLAAASPQTMLDPACGGGLFLMSAFEILTKKTASAGDALKIFRRSIFGVDKDPGAVNCAREALRRMIISFPMSSSLHREVDEALRSNLICADSLDMPLESWRKLFPDPFAHGGFSMVIGNPPYGLSRDGKLSAAEKQNIKIRFGAAVNGKPNKYLAFTALGLELLADSGVLSFVLPNSWLGIKDGLGTRRKLLSDGSIIFLDTFESDVFSPAVEVVVLFWIKGAASDKFTLRHFSEGSAAKPLYSTQLPKKIVVSDPEFKIPPKWDTASEAALRAIRAKSKPLGQLNSLFKPHIAVQAYALGKGSPPQTKGIVRGHSFHSRERKDRTYVKYLNGADIGRFSVSWSGEYISYGPWLSEFQPLRRFSAPRIAVREITAKKPYLIQAAIIKETAVYNKSVLNINLGAEGSEDDLYALLAVLNSRLGSFFVLTAGRKTQRRKFPKLVLADLKDFPFPDRGRGRLSKMGRALMSGAALPEGADLDSAVFEAFGLSASARRQIEKNLALTGAELSQPRPRK